MHIIRMYLLNIKLAYKARMMYPGAFVLAILMQVLAYSAQFAITWILLSSFITLKGWNLYEVVFLHSMQVMTYSIASAFVANTVSDLPSMVKMGHIDDLLTKPFPPLFYLLASRFNVGYIAHFVISAIMMFTSFIMSEHRLAFFNIFVMVIFVLCGALITGSIMLISTIPCIYHFGATGWWGIFYDLKLYTNYPLTIFNRFVQLFFTFVLPFAFISYYPCTYLFGKSEGLFQNGIIAICSPLVAFFLVIMTLKTWNIIIDKYDGTGT